jgi:Putative zinc-finger
MHVRRTGPRGENLGARGSRDNLDGTAVAAGNRAIFSAHAIWRSTGPSLLSEVTELTGGRAFDVENVNELPDIAAKNWRGVAQPIYFRSHRPAGSWVSKLANALLHGYFDGELSNVRAHEYELHVQHCVDCAVALVEQELLRHRLQLDELYQPAPAALRQKIRGHLRSLSSVSAGSRPLLWEWLAAAAALLLLALAVSRMSSELRSRKYETELGGEIVEMHRHSLPPGQMTGIASDNEQIVRQWFDDRLKFALPVRNFADEGFVLQGGGWMILKAALSPRSCIWAAGISSMFSCGPPRNRIGLRTQDSLEAINGFIGESTRLNSVLSPTQPLVALKVSTG